MRSLILLMILGFIGTKTVQSKCVEGEPCATDLTDDKGTPLVRGLESLGHSNATISSIQNTDLQHSVSCGLFSSCPDGTTCCHYMYCCPGYSATCCSGDRCCPPNTRCCGSGISQWCCSRADGCSSMFNMCELGKGRASFTHSTSVASLLLPALMVMAVLL